MSKVVYVALSEDERKQILDGEGHLARTLQHALEVYRATACRSCKHRHGPVEVMGQRTGQVFGDKEPKISNVVTMVRCAMAGSGRVVLTAATRAERVEACARHPKDRRAMVLDSYPGPVPRSVQV